MLTDIFAYRYREHKIWETYGDIEQKLLNQINHLIKEVLPYWYGGKTRDDIVSKYKDLHDRLAKELGVKELAPRYYSYTQKNYNGVDVPVWGSYSYDHIFENFIIKPFSQTETADVFMKERISLIELVMRTRSTEIEALNRNLSLGKKNPTDYLRLTKLSKAENDTFEAQVNELNERFRRAHVPLNYHNGFIQLSKDTVIENRIAKPFWQLVADSKWVNVDIDMKEALDQRDSDGKDPAFYASKALESTIKIISDEKGFTRGSEKGVANYVDNLMKKENAFLETWEGDMLKDFFIKIRNEVGHGPGARPMRVLTLAQTDFAIELAMSWIKSLVLRRKATEPTNH